MTLALHFHDVSFAYEDIFVLKHVNCRVNEGQFVGIIGPNGGGKTTFLKLAMGFLQPNSGRIHIFGKPPRDELAEISYVPQNLRVDKLFPISVTELVLMGRLSKLPWWGRFCKQDEEAAMRALEIVGLTHCKDQSVGSLSGGQFQRALIARAIVSDPRLLILDEPTANVDTQAEHEIYQLLKELSKRMTILMVTHDLNVAVNLVDTILCVQSTVKQMRPVEVCEHFAMGLYHPPLLPGERR